MKEKPSIMSKVSFKFFSFSIILLLAINLFGQCQNKKEAIIGHYHNDFNKMSLWQWGKFRMSGYRIFVKDDSLYLRRDSTFFYSRQERVSQGHWKVTSNNKTLVLVYDRLENTNDKSGHSDSNSTPYIEYYQIEKDGSLVRKVISHFCGTDKKAKYVHVLVKAEYP